MNRRTTSHDVARMAGVSQSTVSLVLNGRNDARIPEPTRQRVMEAARSLNYTRNAAARALLTGRTHRIGVVPIHPLAFVQHGSYYGTLTSSFIAGAMQHDYNVLLHSVRHPHWEALYRDIASGSTDGVILIGRTDDDPLTRALIKARFPTVCVSYQPDAPTFHSVDCDNLMGGALAAHHLIEQGHRRIGFIPPHPHYSWEQLRHEGMERAVQEAGLPTESLVAIGGDESVTSWQETADAFCALPASARPTALVCPDEGLAGYLAQDWIMRGLRVPDDVALVSFNSTEISERAGQTSVWQPLDEIGRAAVDMLIDLFEGKEVTPSTRLFPMRLDIRDSSGAKQPLA